MKQPYEKPKMVVETIEIGTLAAGSPVGKVSQIQPNFGICPPCG